MWLSKLFRSRHDLKSATQRLDSLLFTVDLILWPLGDKLELL